MQIFYTVVAFRFGWTNAHRYDVAVTPSKSEALAIAEDEANDRGGKYGVQVLEWASSRSAKPIAYYSSSYGEDAPAENLRYQVFHRLGQDVHRAVTEGVVWAPSPEGTKGAPCLAELGEKPPQWLLELLLRHERDCRFMARVVEAQIARQKEGLPPPAADELADWVHKAQEAVEQELRDLQARLS